MFNQVEKMKLKKAFIAYERIVNNVYEIDFESTTLKIRFEEKHFAHLCGMRYHYGAKNFYKKLKSDKLNHKHLSYANSEVGSEKARDYMNDKLSILPQIFNADNTFALDIIDSNTIIIKFKISNMKNGSLSFILDGNYYVPYSLRREKVNANKKVIIKKIQS